MQTALTVTPPASKTTTPIGPELTGPIKCWLLDEPSDHTAIATIAKSDILRREAKAVMPALREAALRPATHDQIKQIIGQRFALFPQPQRNVSEAAAWWADYFDALEGLTPFAVEAGMAAWVRSPEAEFMCKPGKLAELARTVPNNNRWARAYSRAERATWEGQIAAAPQPKEPTPPEERPSKEEVAAMMADFHKTMQDKDPFAKLRAKAYRPTPSARVDETGISQEMRAKLAEQRAGM
jgi:hypothetical protein